MRMYRDEPTPRTWPIPHVDITRSGDLVIMLPGYTAFRAIITDRPHPREPVVALCQVYAEARDAYVTVRRLSARRASKALKRAVRWLRHASLRVIEPDRAYPYRPARVVERRLAA